jgi:hypothetical protein
MRAADLAFMVVGLADWPSSPQVASWSPVRMEDGKPVGVAQLHLAYFDDPAEASYLPRCGVTSAHPHFDLEMSEPFLELTVRSIPPLASSAEERNDMQERLKHAPVEATTLGIDGQLLDAKALLLPGHFAVATIIYEGPTLVAAYGSLPLAQLELAALPDYELPDYMSEGWGPT